jgi:glutamate racemase
VIEIDKRAIGVFDSGLGGLTVVKELRKLLPNENIVYFGDTARVPYGAKSKTVILRYSRQISNFLLTKNVKMIVVACNTASSLALEELQKELEIPVIGVIKAGSRRAATATKNNIVGVIGTKKTVSSEVYLREIRSLNSEIVVRQKACPLFVPLVEEGLENDIITEEMAERYLLEIKNEIDTLVLGCTHYPLLKNVIKRVLNGHGINLINPAEETAIDVMYTLSNLNILGGEEKKGETEFYVSDSPNDFQKLGGIFLNSSLENVEMVDIEKYEGE